MLGQWKHPHCWRKRKPVQPFWRRVWRSLRSKTALSPPPWAAQILHIITGWLTWLPQLASGNVPCATAWWMSCQPGALNSTGPACLLGMWCVVAICPSESRQFSCQVLGTAVSQERPMCLWPPTSKSPELLGSKKVLGRKAWHMLAQFVAEVGAPCIIPLAKHYWQLAPMSSRPHQCTPSL